MNLQYAVRKFAIEHKLLSQADRILVAVSGGPDSVALLHALIGLREELSLHLEVAHLQHGIRGEEAKEDAHFVAALAKQLGLPFHLKEIDLPAMKSTAGKGNIEALARAERYRFFAEVVRERKLDKVATAHTRDDQAETVLMWMLRGSGLKGMGGMAPCHQVRIDKADNSEGLTVVRPLLEVSKAEVLDYLEERNLACRVDQTNQDPALLRNWIRLELLPMIERRAGANIAERLSRQAELIRDEDDLLDRVARQRYEIIGGAGALDRGLLLREPKALQRRLLRFWIERIRGHLRGLDFVHVEELLRLIESETPHGRISLPGGWELAREYDRLTLPRRLPRLKRRCYSYDLAIGESLRIPEAGVEILSERTEGPADWWPRGPTEAVFDLKAVTENLLVRNFRPGDRFRPLGMTGHKKVKDLFIDRKVPLSVRADLPLLAMDREILWIPGYARSEIGRVSKKTSAVLRIKVVSISA